MKRFIIIVGILMLVLNLYSAIRVVPDTYASISAAYSAANNGDIIYVKSSGSPYTVASTIVITQGKSITVRGESLTGVVLNGPGSGSMFYVQGNTSDAAQRVTLTLRNLTIQNCSVTGNGGAVRFDNSQYTVLGSSMDTVNFLSCSATNNGGAIYGYKYLPNISYCYFEACSAGSNGGAVYLDHQGNTNLMTLKNSTFYNCSATNGSAVYSNLVSTKVMQITNCTFHGQSTSPGAGTICINSTGNGFIRCYNVSMANNSDYGIKFINTVTSAQVSVLNSIFEDNGFDLIATSSAMAFADLSNNIISSYSNINIANKLYSNSIGAFPSQLLSNTLANNGGVTPTLSLTNYGGAMAIDNGITSGVPTIDQTGAARGSYPDIGALEYDNTKVNRWISISNPSWSSGGNWSQGVAPNESGIKTDFVIIGGVTHTLNLPSKGSGKVYATNFVLRKDGAVNLSGGGAMDIDNLFILSSEVSTGAIKTGQLFTGGSSPTTIAGTVHIEQFLKPGQWNFLSSIDSDIKSNELIPGKTYNTDYYVYQYSEANRANNGSGAGNNEWVSVPSGTTLGVARGYIVWVEGRYRVLYDTYLPNGNTNFTLSYTNSALNVIHKGWNLTGNPYATPMDWDNFTNPGNIDQATYYFNNQYQTYFTILSGVTDDMVPPMQAFFVKSNISAGTLSFTSSLQAIDIGSTFKGIRLDDPKEVVKLSVIQDDTLFFDKTYIRHISTGLRGFEGAYDAYKLWAFNPDVPQLYTFYNSNTFSVNSFDFETAQSYTVAIGYKNLVKDSTYKFVFEIPKGELGMQYQLQDNSLGKVVDLIDNDTIEFTAKDFENASRFKLLISSVATGAEVKSLEANPFYVRGKDGFIELNVSEPYLNSELYVYDLQGRVLGMKVVTSETITFDMTQYRGNILVFVLRGESEQFAKRLFIR